MAQSIVGNVSGNPHASSTTTLFVGGPEEKFPSPDQQQNIAVSGLKNIRGCMETDDLCRFLITNRPGERGLSVANSSKLIPLNVLWNSLIHLLEMKFKYRTTNCRRSAIYAYHTLLNNLLTEQDQNMCRLMTGVLIHQNQNILLLGMSNKLKYLESLSSTNTKFLEPTILLCFWDFKIKTLGTKLKHSFPKYFISQKLVKVGKRQIATLIWNF